MYVRYHICLLQKRLEIMEIGRNDRKTVFRHTQTAKSKTAHNQRGDKPLYLGGSLSRTRFRIHFISMAQPSNHREGDYPTYANHTGRMRTPSHDFSLDGGDDTQLVVEPGTPATPRNKSYYWDQRSKDGDDVGSLPIWTPGSGNPQSGILMDGQQQHHHQQQPPFRKTLVFTARKRKSSFHMTVALVFILVFCLYSSTQSSLEQAVEDGDRLAAFTVRLKDQLEKAHNDVRMLERELAALDKMEQKREDFEEEQKILDQAALFTNPKMVEEVSAIQQKLKISADKAQKLKEQVQKISKLDALEKYGPGPYRIEMELTFPGNQAGATKFEIEMAPLDLMPHSVYTFMEMASLGLLDGCSFILNALHVVKAAPLPSDGSFSQDKGQQFAANGLESVAFREYSSHYPHKRYTVGFAADGTPSFYINTDDNTEIHIGDPCFGTVVSGIETVKRLEASPTRNGIWFENRIGIKSAKVVEQ
jgi:cyclophilin family peptidyl-prolyl cis-trans isomerase